MVIETGAEAAVAADITAVWGLTVRDSDFLHRDTAQAVAAYPLNSDEREKLTRAINDNVSAFRQWVHQDGDSAAQAVRWSLQRPRHLNPVRYKHATHTNASQHC